MAVDISGLGGWSPALYPLILVTVALDALMPPLPAEVLVVTSGALAASGHALLPVAWLSTVLGSFVGDLLVYGLFRRRLTHVLDRFRWGRAVHRLIRRAVERGGRSSTAAAMVAGRFLPAGRTATMAAAGVAALPAIRVVRASALGSALWASWTVGLGYLTGRTIDLPFWANSLIGAALGLGVGILMAAILAIRRRAGRPRKNATHPLSADSGSGDGDGVGVDNTDNPGS